MKVAIAQLNLLVGDIEGNAQQVIDVAERLKQQSVDLVVYPELTLTGYPPEDLLLRPACQQRVDAALQNILQQISGITLVFGFPAEKDGERFNMAAAVRDGQFLAQYQKRELPNYSVFDEKRYFSAGNTVSIFEQQGICFGLTVCEDIWFEAPVADSAAAGAQVILNLNASPFNRGKLDQREQAVVKLAQRNNVSIVYANQVGGQDELVFDGASFVADSAGKICMRCPQFDQSEAVFEIEADAHIVPLPEIKSLDENSEIYAALVCGVHDYVTKNGFKGVVLGLSGGIDSALTLAIAVDALGAENVEVALMPSCYTADMSNEDAVKQAVTQNVKYQTISIEPAFSAFKMMLSDAFVDQQEDVTEENIQARCRGLVLMAMSNKFGRMLLTTGNKSEMSVGYATLYGDMNGGFAPLKDVPKLLVYELCRWRNRNQEIIPQRVIDRPPSAELREDQKDSDSLPDYKVLDEIIERYVELDQSADDIVEVGFDRQEVERITRLIDINEYKRRQAPPGVKITLRAYGRDRRYPIVSGF